MKPNDLKADLTAVSSIYALIIVLTMWFHSNYKAQKELSQLKSDYALAKIIVVQQEHQLDELYEALNELNLAYDEVESKFYNDVPEMCKLIGIYVNLRDNISP